MSATLAYVVHNTKGLEHKHSGIPVKRRHTHVLDLTGSSPVPLLTLYRRFDGSNGSAVGVSDRLSVRFKLSGPPFL